MIEKTTDLKDAVYPCVYREHMDRAEFASANYGLSLCVQGTRVGKSFDCVAVRFIPVCTGNTKN